MSVSPVAVHSLDASATNGELRERVAIAEQTKGVLLIGADFQALGVVRALNEAGIPVFLLEQERGIAWASRYVSRRKSKCDLLTDPGSVDWLLELAKTEKMQGWPIFCVDDDTVEFLAKNHETLSTSFVLPVPKWTTTQKFFEKNQSSVVASECGIPVPIEYPSSSLEELLASEIQYPVILKPTFKKNYYSATNDKAIFVPDEATLIREFQAMNQLIDTNQILVQEFLTGGPRNLFSFATIFDGRNVVSGMTGHRIRQHPMDFGHATTFAISEDNPELEELATRFLRALNYRGVAEVEFMFDEQTGTYKFIEMNGRFWGWHGLTRAAGLNFPEALFKTMLGQDSPRVQPRIGATWVRMLTDTPTVLREVIRRRMSPSILVQTFFSKSHDAVWSWKDPIPFLVECAIAPYLLWKKGF